MAGYDAWNPFAGYGTTGMDPTQQIQGYGANYPGAEPFNIGAAINPVSMGINAATGLIGMLSGSGAATKQKQILGYQRQIAEQQRNLFSQAAPQYQQALEQYANQIGLSNSLGLNGYSSSVGVSPHQAARLGIDPNTTFDTGTGPSAQNGYLMGPYDQQAFRLRSAAAEQNLQHQMQGADQNLLFQAQQRGLASGSTAAALAREHQGLLQNYGDYQRNLAINAGTQEQQNLQNYLAMLGPGMGQGGQAAAGYNNLQGIYGQQANQGFAGAGQALGAIGQMYGQTLPYPQQQPYGGYGGYGGYPQPSPYQYPPPGGLSGSGSNY